MKRMMSFVFSIGFVLLHLSGVHGNQHTTIVLVGATGDLASKYLWQSIFNTYHNSIYAYKKNDAERPGNHSFSLIGVARSAQEKGNALLSKKLQESINCEVGYLKPTLLAECNERKRVFINDVDYVQVSKDAQDFVKLCSHIEKKIPKSDFYLKKDVIMFMAISSTAYMTFLENFKKTCDKSLFQSQLNIRWALEKPFGVDKLSAQDFAYRLRSNVDEKDVLHVDHYLQKSIVKTILSFRSLNPHLEKVWNKDNIERVEVVLKETLDVKDRIVFYNSMGVLRDIHQNHLTELLTLVAMELPADNENTDEIAKCKSDLIKQMEPVKTPSSLFGQYADYAKHAALQITNDTKTVDVPTFAATLVKINSGRWRGVPFLLVSGKQLDKRESYIKVIFKDANFCVSHCQFSTSVKTSQPKVVFHIGHGSMPMPSILVTKSFKRPLWPGNISEMKSTEGFNTSAVYETPVNQFFIGAVVNDIPAYQSVIGDLVQGDSGHFVTTQRLLLSWHIWDQIITADKNPRIYDKGDPHRDLNFKFTDRTLDFIHSGMVTRDFVGLAGRYTEESPALFLGRKLVTAPVSQLSTLLAKAISEEAKENIQKNGIFHIAFSGGSSVLPVLRSLSSQYSSLPWDSVHIWQVDERCVPHHDEKSNFGLLDRELFQKVNIPFSNIHAMPVDIAGELCEDSLGGAHFYTESIKQHVHKSQFDIVILGVGTDGHTASLFPGSPALHVDSDTLVTISDDGPDDSKRRMSLTLPVINQSKKIAILVTGKHKRNILWQLETSFSLDRYPILGVNPKNGTITWYIDDAANAMDYDHY